MSDIINKLKISRVGTKPDKGGSGGGHHGEGPNGPY